ncbi:rhamnosyltransferase WsaF family glycosyltransferase [Methylorubrum extorquens]|uniref:rhamnosyltransferase WsaF family glycosyltransferase n=1 Tax=Methylorubrum extorquens TaxID=408 RepID=UPI0011BE0369|nr:rhamnan synthesis F family protein [Methylorubrum extorquens]
MLALIKSTNERISLQEKKGLKVIYLKKIFRAKMWRYKKSYKIIRQHFDINFYLKENPDVRAGKQDPILHYLEHGSREGRRPTPGFDVHFYTQKYASEIGEHEPFTYYIKYGRDKNHSTSRGDTYVSQQTKQQIPDYELIESEFDADYYLNENHDVRKLNVDPIIHYLQHGRREGRRPTPDFDPAFYAEEYASEVGEKDPFTHYIKYGRKKGYKGAIEEYYYSDQLVYPDGVVPSRRPRNENDYAMSVPFPEKLRSHPYKKTAAIIHAFYPELMEEVFGYLNQSNCVIDLFISTDTNEKAEEILLIKNTYTNGLVEVRVTENRGRDIGPMITSFKDVFTNYEAFLHIHTKRSPHGGDGLSSWREYLFKNLIGSAEVIDSNLHILSSQNVGIVYPQHLYNLRGILNWGYNFDIASSLLRKIKIRLSKDMVLEFPSGSMFWARTAAFRRILSLDLKLEDFDREAGQVDGTLSHAIERLFLFFAEASGYAWIKIIHSDIDYPHKNCVLPVASEEQFSHHFKRVYRPLLTLPVSGAYPLNRSIAPCRELLFYPSSKTRKRVILLVPSVNPRQVFGGVTTALKLFHDMARYASPSVDFAILATDASIEPEGISALPEYTLKPFLSEEEDARFSLIDVSSRSTGRFPIRSGDVFFATAWWTALIAKSGQKFQETYFGDFNKFIYLIQDFEPNFYGWGTMYALAEATYRDNKRFYPIINSEELYRFFRSETYAMTDAVCLPYRLNDRINLLLNPRPREKVLIFYGRPSTHRNLFEIICNALVLWQTRNPVSSSSWRVISLGEDYPKSWLNPIQNTDVLGKITLEQYAYWLSRSSIGVSLMLSPHPSYPPLEMAEAGLMTITNDYAFKSMSSRFDLMSLPYVDEESLADYIEICVNRYDTGDYSINTGRCEPKLGRQEDVNYFTTENLIKEFDLNQSP